VSAPRVLAGGEERRTRLLERLAQARRALAGAELATALGVSRQVVVQDVAILRAGGAPILATARGYLLPGPDPQSPVRALLAVRHTPEQTPDELLLLVDHGLRVVDVVVDHPLYGELRGVLMLESRADVESWWQTVRRCGARLLSELTGGLHLHTVEARRAEAIESARAALRARGYLVEEAAERADETATLRELAP
jgi:transcriptional regulator of NAD metabolism